MKLRSIITKILPWVITVAAIYAIFKEFDIDKLKTHIVGANWYAFTAVFLITATSYLLRAKRWEYLVTKPFTRYTDALKILILGFFMNNVLPARTGELVRAHFGARMTGDSRSSSLASVASERLADGLTLSLFLVLFGLSGSKSSELLAVAGLFLAAGVCTALLIAFRKLVFSFFEKLTDRYGWKVLHFSITRAESFIEGLAPMFHPKRLPILIFFSLLIWSIELTTYYLVSVAFHSKLSFSACVIFMVTANFSSLIPAAPGGIGVIEFFTTQVLVALGVEKEHAFSMVLTLHMIQYITICIPGILIMLQLRKLVPSTNELKDEAQTALTQPS